MLPMSLGCYAGTINDFLKITAFASEVDKETVNSSIGKLRLTKPV
jgi:hypothetical protein